MERATKSNSHFSLGIKVSAPLSSILTKSLSKNTCMHCIPCMRCLIFVSLGDVWGTVCHSLRANGVLNPILFLMANLGKNDAPERKLRFFVPPFVRSDLSLTFG